MSLDRDGRNCLSRVSQQATTPHHILCVPFICCSMRVLQCGDVVRHFKGIGRLGTIMYISQNRERLAILFYDGDEEWRWASAFEVVSEASEQPCTPNLLCSNLTISSRASALQCDDVVRHFKSWRLGTITAILQNRERSNILFHDGEEEWRWTSACEKFEFV